MASYASHNFEERGSSGLSNPGWDRKFSTVVKIIPNGEPVVQAVGADVPRLAMPIRCSAAQLAALYGDVDGDTHDLVWSRGTDTALLEAIDTPTEVLPGKDYYFTVLHLIKQ